MGGSGGGGGEAVHVSVEHELRKEYTGRGYGSQTLPIGSVRTIPCFRRTSSPRMISADHRTCDPPVLQAPGTSSSSSQALLILADTHRPELTLLVAGARGGMSL